MNSERYRRMFRNSSHASDDDLIEYLDGMSSARRSSQIRLHLQECWSCRVRSEKIEGAIADYVEYCQDVVPPPSENLSTRFSTRLRNLALERARAPETARRWPPWVRRIRIWPKAPKWAFGLLAFLVMLLMWTTVEIAPPVSAKEILSHSKSAEADRIRQVPDAIVYQKLTVMRRAAGASSEERASLEIWNDSTGKRYRRQPEDHRGAPLVLSRDGARSSAGNDKDHRSAEPLLEDLEQIYRKNKMNDRRPLSPEGYLAWRDTIRAKSEQVREIPLADGSKAWSLTATAEGPYENDEIVQAELVVQAANWHPVETRLQVKDMAGLLDFQVTETAYQVLPSSSLPSSFFIEPSLPLPAVAGLAAPHLSPAPLSMAEAAAREVEANYVLHRLNACLGEPISVSRIRSNQVEVRGLAATVQRREQIAAALNAIPGIVMEIETFEEAARRRGGADRQPDRQIPRTVLQVDSGRLPIQDQLERYFSQSLSEAAAGREGPGLERRVADFAGEAVRQAAATRAEAWALRLHTDEYSGPTARYLDPNSRRFLIEMVQDHVRALNGRADRLRRLIEPVLREVAPAGPAESMKPANPESAGRRSWSDQVTELSSLCERMDRWIAVVFTGVILPSVSTEQAMEQLLKAFASLQAGIESLDQELARVSAAGKLQSAQRPSR